VDDAARRIIRFPKTMDVLVCMNQYGDILSDVAGEVAGGLGVAPSANFGDDGWAYFESVHGSAPDIAGRGIANPTGTLLSAALMLEHLGLAARPSACRPPSRASIATARRSRPTSAGRRRRSRWRRRCSPPTVIPDSAAPAIPIPRAPSPPP